MIDTTGEFSDTRYVGSYAPSCEPVDASVGQIINVIDTLPDPTPGDWDVVIEVHAPSGKRHVHAFDAKYRRETASHPFWIPLSEDIDKMHAYRDAIGQVTPKRFTRTLQSAIVLFPAPSDKRYRSHRFYKSLSHGIGALPLLPGDPKTLQEFQTFLTNHLLKK